MSHLPFHIRPHVDAKFYDGYADIFKFLILNFFVETRMTDILTVSTFMQMLETGPASDWASTRHFLAVGGKIEWALDCLSCEAQHGLESPLFPPFDEMYQDDEEWSQLPRCKNDKAFAMVRTRLGLDPYAVWGPYVDEEAERETARQYFASLTDEKRKMFDEIAAKLTENEWEDSDSGEDSDSDSDESLD